MDEQYRTQLNTVIENLHMTPTGTILAESAKQAIALLNETDNSIKDLYKKLEEKIERRRVSANRMADAENVQNIGLITYGIRPARIPRTVELRTDFQKQSSGTAPKVSSFTIETKKQNAYDNFVKLPTFDGNIEEWSAFFMIFEPTVIKNDNYANVMKHNILRNHLRGEPLDLIRPYSTDGSQFTAVIDRLSERYGSKEKQYAHLWNKLCSLPMARENPKSLRILHNELYAIINSLKNQGTEIETQNYQVEIKKKLPRSILVDLLKAKPADTTNLLKELDLLITIEESKHHSFHIQLSMNQSYHVNAIESKIDCSIEKTTPFTGCYNCFKGASQNVTCKSKEPTHAKLSCDNGEFFDILTCDKTGVVNEIHKKFNESNPRGKTPSSTYQAKWPSELLWKMKSSPRLSVWPLQCIANVSSRMLLANSAMPIDHRHDAICARCHTRQQRAQHTHNMRKWTLPSKGDFASSASERLTTHPPIAARSKETMSSVENDVAHRSSFFTIPQFVKKLNKQLNNMPQTLNKTNEDILNLLTLSFGQLLLSLFT
ncbi:hypothetical protein CAEBREN_20501 [Caenorhabditis brenneri]|uniref:Uncharacterized protein n=1 Tax=Caenorhabditis brenneri TaxID=135651 RepID=G0N2L8_CAEBE|nr:hypothetical protein CAEBREN_20501 [Caenorhabditis brenneri]